MHHPDLLPRRLRHALAATLLAAAGAAAAQDASPTRIVAATIYPDGASVERELKVPGGTRHVTLACLPEAVDVATLQVDGDSGLRVGEIHAVALPASRVDECAPSSVEARRAALDARRAALEARRESDDIALAWLRQWGTHAPADAVPASPPTRAAADARPGATADGLRRAALDLLTDQAGVRSELAALDKAVAKLADEQPAARGKQGWRTVRFDVWTPAAATLRVRYAVSGAWWRPTYRAAVDTAHASLRLERQADVVQASGEDWQDVRIRLSTGRQRRPGRGATPTTWWVDLAPTPVAPVTAYAAAPFPAAAPPAPAPMLAESRRRDEPAPPPWLVDVAQSGQATEFALADAVAMPSDGDTRTLTISTQSLPATLVRRSAPRTDATVWLLAEAARPDGVWLPGTLQAYRDGTLVGRGNWQPASGDQLEIALGEDDRMRVDVESPASFTATTGLLGGRAERSAKSTYVVVNGHDAPVTLELLDAAPVSRNEQVRVRSTYAPQPTTTAWRKTPGVVAWTLPIAAGASSRVDVTQAVSWPKDAEVANLP